MFLGFYIVPVDKSVIMCFVLKQCAGHQCEIFPLVQAIRAAVTRSTVEENHA